MTIHDLIPLQHEWIRIIKYCGGEGAEVYDILQDFYIKMMSIQDKEGSLDRMFTFGEPNKGYMFSTLRNMTYLHKKKNHRYSSLTPELYLTLSSKEDEHRENMIEERRLHKEYLTMERVLESMKTEEWFCWRVFTLYRDEGHTIRSLAEATHISTKTIFNTIKYVKGRIREAHGGAGGPNTIGSGSIGRQKVNGMDTR